MTKALESHELASSIMRLFWAVLSGAALWGGTAWAGDREVLQEVAKCADIAGATERLKCFDAAVPHAQTALAAPAPAVVASAQTTQTEGDSGGVLGWFGFESKKPVTKPEDFGKPPVIAEGPKEITRLMASVTEFAHTPSGKALFILENGQVWRQIDGDPTEVANPGTGETLKVAIEKAMMGSYDLTIDGRNGFIKVRRVK